MSHVITWTNDDSVHWHTYTSPGFGKLTPWGRVTHIWASKLAIIGSDNGSSPDRRQAIIWTNDGILFIGPLGTNFNEILIKSKFIYFHSRECSWNCHEIGGHFISASMCLRTAWDRFYVRTLHKLDCKCPISWIKYSMAPIVALVFSDFHATTHVPTALIYIRIYNLLFGKCSLLSQNVFLITKY